MSSLAARTAILALAVVCGLSRIIPAQESTGPDTSKIIALENAWSRASETKDLKAMDRILAEAFVYVDVNGRLLTKAEVLQDVKESGVQQVVTEAMAVHLYGDTAVVTGAFRMKGVKGREPFLQRGRFVDTWVYRNGLWVCVASAGTLITH